MWPNGMMEAAPGRLCPVRVQAYEPAAVATASLVEEFETE